MVHETHVPLSAEITAYTAVAETIRNSSYIGLEATATDNLRDRNFPMLVSIALLYHQLHLETEVEKLSFGDYDIEGVMAHLSTQCLKKLARDYDTILPSSRITTTVRLLRTLRLESAEMIMTRRTPEERMEIIYRMRVEENPGPWMVEKP